MVRRRRSVSGVVRHRLVAVRFSEAELAAVQERAALAELAVGAWVGQAAVEACDPDSTGSAGLPDLLRLHADVVAVAGSVDNRDTLERLLGRLDAAVQAIATARRL